MWIYKNSGEMSDALLAGFEGVWAKPGDRIGKYDSLIADDIVTKIFGKATRLSSAVIIDEIKKLAVKKKFDYGFCRRLAYYFVCFEQSNEDYRTNGTSERPSHYWSNPETDMEPWR